MLLSSEIAKLVVGAHVVATNGGRVEVPYRPGILILPESKIMAYAQGFPRNSRDLIVSVI